MISAQGISLSFGDRTLLKNINVNVDAGSRIGLVGANGSGKSTLLRIMAGEISADDGSIQRSRDTVTAYLPQKMEIDGSLTVYEGAETAFSWGFQLLQEREDIASTLLEETSPRLLSRLAEIDERLESSAFYDRSVAIGIVLAGLGFSSDDLQRKIESFSGGWRMRVALSRVLLSLPDILLLDEPTNYLDTEAREWLLGFLQHYRGGVVIVSHDRAFLDDLVSEVLELFNEELHRYRGNYSTYETERSRQLEQLIARYERQQREIDHIETFIRRFRYNSSKAAMVQSRIKQLEKIERIRLPVHLKPISITLPPAPDSGEDVLVVEALNRRYGEVNAVVDLELTVRHGERLAVAGPNGAGKSTFLRIAAGVDPGYSGTMRTGTGVLVGYFGQESAQELPSDETVRSYCESLAPYDALPTIRDILGAFLFSGEDVDKPVSVLSGGERTRLVIASLLIRPTNLLVLDEPTNHLDLTSKDVLARALRSYSGTVIFVSHDRAFNEAVATTVLAFRRTGTARRNWTLYPGDFSYYRHQTARVVDEETVAKPVRSDSPVVRGASDFAEQKAVKAKMRKLERREAEIMAELDSVESARQDRELRLADPSVYADGETVRTLSVEINELEAREEALHGEWEVLESERENLTV